MNFSNPEQPKIVRAIPYHEGDPAIQTERVIEFLLLADSMVWTQEGWPQNHRPNTDYLKQNIHVGSLSPSKFNIHPGIKPSVRRELVENTTAYIELDKLNHKSEYDPLLNAIYLTSDIATFPDEIVRRFIFHEAGHAVLGTEVVPMHKIPAQQRRYIKDLLKLAFKDAHKIDPNRVKVRKIGYRQVITVDGYMLSDMAQNAGTFDEIYTTLFETITDQVLLHNGDIAAFESAVKAGKAVVPSNYEHPIFTNMLFAYICRGVDWRVLLDAFKSADPSEVYSVLEKKTGDEHLAREVVFDFFSSMKQDEQAITEINQAAKQQGLV